MKKKSPLSKRILEQVRQLPFENSDKFVDEVINKTCRPVGYFPVTDPEQYRDFYNFCLFQLIKASEENKGDDLDNILFDQPLVSLLSKKPLAAYWPVLLGCPQTTFNAAMHDGSMRLHCSQCFGTVSQK